MNSAKAPEVTAYRLTDVHIVQKSQNRVIVHPGNFNFSKTSLKNKMKCYPYVGGVYDSSFFGSAYPNSCNCGRVKTANIICQSCGSEFFDEKKKLTRYARIESPWYYVMKTKEGALLQFLKLLPLNYRDALEFLGKKMLVASSAVELMNKCQFNWNPNTEQIDVKCIIDDKESASYEGLDLIIESYFPEMKQEYHTIINRYVLVAPAAYREASFDPYNDLAKLKIPHTTSVYQAAVSMIDTVSGLVNSESDPTCSTLLKASLRLFLGMIPYEVSRALQGGKANIARQMYSTRIANSGRAPIVGDPKLKLDELRLPIHLAYELLKTDFKQHLIDIEFTTRESVDSVYNLYEEDTLKVFEEYCLTRRVLFNRPPSLHRYNILSFKILLTEDYGIHIPTTVCGPFNADFDGDAMMFYLVPKSQNEYVDSQISPANITYYEASNEFIFKPNHEIIYGLTLASRIDYNVDEKTIPKYVSDSDVEAAWEDQEIQFPLDVFNYNGRLMTYGYFKLNKILKVDLEDLIGKGKEINTKSVAPVLKYINDLAERVDMYQKFTEWGLEVITLEGSTVPPLHEMLSLDSEELTKELKDVIELSKIDRSKIIEVESKYQEILKRAVDSISPEFSKRIEDSNRIKQSQVTDMMIPQLVVSSTGEYHVSNSSLINGMSEEDYRRHAVNNRSLLQKKQDLVPKSGYLSRQIIFASQGPQFFVNLLDPTNEGIWIRGEFAEGRTDLNGNLLKATSGWVKVRSVAVTKNEDFGPDLLPQVFNTYADGANIGSKFGSSVGGDITQAGLSLKHGGVLAYIDPDCKFYAPEDCVVYRIGDTQLKLEFKSRTVIHPVPKDFIVYQTKVKKGNIIGFLDKMIGPEHLSSQMIDLLGGLATTDISDNSRTKEYGLNVAVTEGVIKYSKGYVQIGPTSYPIDSTKIYHHVEGTPIKKFDFICSGVLDCASLKPYTSGSSDYYNAFRVQFKKLLPKVVEEVIEFMFRVVHMYEGDNLVYTGIKERVFKDKNFFTALSYEGNKGLLAKTLTNPEKINKTKDLYSNMFINFLREKNNP